MGFAELTLTIKVGPPICCECCGDDIYYGQSVCSPCFIIQGDEVEYCQCCDGCPDLAN